VGNHRINAPQLLFLWLRVCLVWVYQQRRTYIYFIPSTWCIVFWRSMRRSYFTDIRNNHYVLQASSKVLLIM
jgi:hypothetical protein